MDNDAPDPQPPATPPAGPAPAIRPGRVVVASARIAVGSVLLVRQGLTRLLDDAIVAGATAPGTASPDRAVRTATVAAPFVSATRDAAGRVARLTGTIAGATPAALRDPIDRRLSGLRVSAAEERARSTVVATATLETAARFMTDWIVERLDVNRIVERLRLDDIIGNLELTDVILSSTGGVTGRVLDDARARAVGADALVDRVLAHVLRRSVPRGAETGPTTIAPVAPT